MKVSVLFEQLDRWTQVDTQEEYDNSGAQILQEDADVVAVYITLDPTLAAMQRAAQSGANVVLTHHPLYFDLPAEEDAPIIDSPAATFAKENKLSVYSAHTNLDIMDGGLNERVARLIGIKNPVRLTEREGFIGDVDPCTLTKYAGVVRDALDEDGIRVYGSAESQVFKVAVVNGTGGRDENVITIAKNQGADVFVSAEFKHSVIRFALENGLSLIEFTHYKSELPFVALAAQIIESKCGVRVTLDTETKLLY